MHTGPVLIIRSAFPLTGILDYRFIPQCCCNGRRDIQINDSHTVFVFILILILILAFLHFLLLDGSVFVVVDIHATKGVPLAESAFALLLRFLGGLCLFLRVVPGVSVVCFPPVELWLFKV
jgi:hypothetical protein